VKGLWHQGEWKTKQNKTKTGHKKRRKEKQVLLSRASKFCAWASQNGIMVVLFSGSSLLTNKFQLKQKQNKTKTMSRFKTAS